MNRTYIVARSETSYRMFIKRNMLDPFAFVFLSGVQQVHETDSGTVFIFIDGSTKRKDYRAIADTIHLRTDLVRTKEF